MSKGNPVSNFISKYQSHLKNPLVQAAVIGGVSIPTAFLLRKPVYRFLKNRVRDPRVSKALFGMLPYEAIQSLELMLNSKLGKWGAPLLLGAMPALASLVPNIVPDAPMWGLTSWNPKVNRPKENKKEKTPVKTGLSNFGVLTSMLNNKSLFKTAQLFQDVGYQPQLDLTKSVNRQQAINMINTNPFLLLQDSYARHLGTSIISAAPTIGNQVTLGGIYDSAVNKFDTKLQFLGLGNKVVKGVVSGALAGMFTDVVGTVIGMPLQMRIGLSNTVGVGKALHSILT